MKPGAKPNRLAREKSPYLLQHAYNPVDWYPWGNEAFARAKREDKPIFLSVGYSTCHWCHVMERESFEDSSLAELLNRWFVPIKVDREERPDVDRVYMNAAFAMTGGGGWPLTVFLTPAAEPFYAGTYFPPDARQGRPGLRQVLEGVHEAWTNRRAQVDESAASLTAEIRRAMQVRPDSAGVDPASLAGVAYDHMARMFDPRWGGFGPAPKFPQPSYLFFLFRRWVESGDARARDMALVTLRRMAEGGLHDHLGGGFHRYSTDAEWRVPHFEKMLYDQAQLATAYIEAYQITGDRIFADVAREVLDYVARDLGAPQGGFYSAEDADSPGKDGEPREGAFYVWTAAEVESLLGGERARPFLDHYGFTEQGNFEDGTNVLHAAGTIEETARRFQVDPAELERRLAEDRARLFRERAKRPRPHLDDKVLTSWNGLMISAYARAHQLLGDQRYLERARRAADFLLAHCYDEGMGTLRRRFRDGESAIPGELTDYAFLVQGLLDLYEASFDVRDLERALALTDRMIERFWDREHGGFFDTAEDASALFVRSKEAHDGAEPSGNSIAVLDLARLARMTGRSDLEEKGRATLELFASHIARSPLALTQMWSSAHFLAGKPTQVVIAGDPGSPGVRELLRVARARFSPRQVVLLADGGKGQRWLSARLEFLGALPKASRATAYVCEDFTCKLPTSDKSELAKLLAAGEPALSRP